MVDPEEWEKSVGSVPMQGKKSKEMDNFIRHCGEFWGESIRITYLWLPKRAKEGTVRGSLF
jgi:hypothetical protein